MEFPAGEVLEESIKINEINIEQVLKELIEQKFSGYLVVTIYGYTGIEEGLILFRDGITIGSFYEYNQINTVIEGDNALLESLNALKAKYGIMDINALSKQQAELIVTFKDAIKTKERSLQELKKMLPQKYSTDYSKKVLRETSETEKSRYEVMKALGLVELE